MLISIFVGIIAYICWRKGQIKGNSFISLPLLAFYLSFVLTITIISRIPSITVQYNFIPFWSYKAIFSGEVKLIAQVFWNVVLFIPIGILLMLFLITKHKSVIVLFLSLLLSSSIEVIQLVTHRGLFEFDDIVHNSLGAIIGVYLYYFASSIVKRLNSQNNN